MKETFVRSHMRKGSPVKEHTRSQENEFPSGDVEYYFEIYEDDDGETDEVTILAVDDNSEVEQVGLIAVGAYGRKYKDKTMKVYDMNKGKSKYHLSTDFYLQFNLPNGVIPDEVDKGIGSVNLINVSDKTPAGMVHINGDVIDFDIL